MAERSSALLARITATAPALLRERLGQGAQLAELQLLKDATRTVVARAVIIKRMRDDAPTGFSEWAALAVSAQRGWSRTMGSTRVVRSR